MTDFTPPSDNPFDQIDPHSTQVEYPTHADAPAPTGAFVMRPWRNW